MNSKTFVLVPLLIAGAIAFSLACGDDDEGGDSTGAEMDIATATLTALPSNGESNDRDDFVTTVEARLEQLQTQIDELESEIEGMDEDLSQDAQARLDSLKQTKQEIESDLEEAESAQDGDFETLKQEIEDRVDNAMTEAQELADEIGI